MAVPGMHELAGHVPSYIAGPGGDDVLFSRLSVFILVLVVLIGVTYFRLHALPESIAHRENHAQFQLVGVLSLVALFTHDNIFWIAALLLAAVRLPNFTAPLQAIADNLKELARPAGRPAVQEAPTAGPMPPAKTPVPNEPAD